MTLSGSESRFRTFSAAWLQKNGHIEFPDPETGELVTGYIYKANLAEVVPDATESAEVTETIPETTESQTEPTEWCRKDAKKE